MASYDYIIVGAGSAGCVLANRLTEDPDVTVLLLEAGGEDRHPWLKIPIKFRDLMTDRRWNWGYDSETEPHMDGRSIWVPRGKVLGGSSSINGMIYARGHPLDFDQWRQMGLAGWGYADVLPYFKKSEGHERGETAHHGAGGPLRVRRMKAGRGHQAYVASARANGHPVSDDINGAEPEGFVPAEFTITPDGRRSSTAKSFLRPAMARPGLTVETEAHAAKVVVENGRAVGLDYLKRGEARTARAEREVILSGGAYNSPQLLMLSGIGPADHLREHGIEVVLDLPNVGQNLQDHISVGYNVACTDPDFTLDDRVRFDRMTWSVLEWTLFRTGWLTNMELGGLAFIRTRDGLDRPDVEFILRMLAPGQHMWFPGIKKPLQRQIGAALIQLHPESIGSVTLRSADPTAKARIFHNYFAEKSDLETLRRGVRAARDLFAAEPLKSVTGDELAPGADATTDDEIDAYIRANASTMYHPVGTCRMGVDAESVVDEALRVRGTEGLRVVDASVMPTVPGGHTNAPTIMIAEKAADMIRGRQPLPRAEP